MGPTTFILPLLCSNPSLIGQSISTLSSDWSTLIIWPSSRLTFRPLRDSGIGSLWLTYQVYNSCSSALADRRRDGWSYFSVKLRAKSKILNGLDLWLTVKYDGPIEVFVISRINEKVLRMETKLKADSGGGLVSSFMVRIVFAICFKFRSILIFQGWYDYLMVDLRDPRVDSWPLMSSIWPTVIICALYVYVVKVAGPR